MLDGGVLRSSAPGVMLGCSEGCTEGCNDLRVPGPRGLGNEQMRGRCLGNKGCGDRKMGN